MDSFDEKRMLSALERIAVALERQNDISEKHLALIREELVSSDARLQTLYAGQSTPIRDVEWKSSYPWNTLSNADQAALQGEPSQIMHQTGIQNAPETGDE